MTHQKLILFTAVTALACTTALKASPIIVESHTFDGGTENWTATPYPSSDLVFDWNAGGWLEMTGNTTVGGDGDFLTIANSASTFVGNWNTDVWGIGNNAWVSFDLYADTGTASFDYPSSLYLYFESNDGGGAHEWWYDLSNQAQTAFTANPNTWQGFSATLAPGDSGGWGSPTGGTLAEWTGGFENVTEFGVYLSYPIGDGQTFGLDNFDLIVPIPEPGAMMLLGSALLSLSLTFRKQIKTRASELLG